MPLPLHATGRGNKRTHENPFGLRSRRRSRGWRLQLDTGLTEVATGQRFQVEYRLSDRWSAQASESSAESSQFDSFLVDFKLKYRIFID